MSSVEEQLEELFEPQAPFSDYKKGECIIYCMGKEIRSGEILNVIPPRQEGSQHIPLTYVVDNGHGFPDMIWQTDVIENRRGEQGQKPLY